jgi:hypothetical protein
VRQVRQVRHCANADYADFADARARVCGAERAWGKLGAK